MKNLIVHRQNSRVLKFLEDKVSCNLKELKVLHAINPNNDDFYLAFENKLYEIPSDYEREITVSNYDENLKLIDLEYSSILQELYGVCETGEIIRIDVENKCACNVVTELNVNIECMKFSPDHEILILVTTDGTVITMVSTFQIISEVDLHSFDFGKKQFVTVGWGKKETQFHGSEGKKAAIVKPVEINANDSDDGLCRITWREDGSLFAVGFLHRESKARKFKVFNREGVLQYTSELTNGLEESLSWKPSGGLIAATQKLANKHVVALFEKNGLKHREFSLPFEPNEITVRNLFWSPDSEILSVWCELHKNSTSILQLWAESNYHWYLKQTIKFPVVNPLIYATWGTASTFKRLMLLTSKEFCVYDYDWCINHSRGKDINDKAVIGVIDGNKLLVTGLRIGIIPPPMAHQVLDISESINAVVFAPDIQYKDSWIDSNTFFCVTNSNKLIFYKHLNNSSGLEYEYIGLYNIEWNVSTNNSENMLYNLHHFLWFNENTILCSTSKANQCFLCVLVLEGLRAQNQGQITVQEMHLMDDLIEHILPSPKSKDAYVVVNNSYIRYTKEMELIPTDIELHDYSQKIEIAKISTRCVLLSLSHRNSFSIDGKPIANNVTSFYVHSEFLLLTTLQHTLVCVPLNEQGFKHLLEQDLTIKPWENNVNGKSWTDLNVRRIERGSYLIAAMSGDSKVILQMPRGNLECIQPRALSLYIIGYYLNSFNYLFVFDLMRRQRINLNLIYDHDPQKFVENVEKFVDEISKPTWLSLFLSELEDNDITTTIYKDYYWKDDAKAINKNVNKVGFVCDLLREVMEKRNNRNYFIQPILISLVKNKRKQGLEAALMKIKELKELKESTKNAECIAPDDALKYLLYLVDINMLFDTALGMYDFDLTMFIASKSQKDPKEYIPFLNSLKKLDNNYMKYSIDLHLKRYESALEHIANDQNRFNECIDLIRNHNLYRKALALFDKGSTEYKEVAKVYGEFLLKQRKYQEAGIMFHKSNSFNEASNAYKLAGSWQEVILVSTQMNLSLSEKHALYAELVERLKSDKRYQEAANIMTDYLKDVEQAVILLCDGRHWKNALRIAFDTQRLDLIETHVKRTVYEYAEHIMLQLQKNRQDFEKYKSRLAVVRANISKRHLQLSDGINGHSESIRNGGISDILSDTSSVADSTSSQRSRSSVISGRSYRSSKNRRKQERKLLSLKEGSVFEDLGLIQALYHLISNTYKETENLSTLVQMLVHFNDDTYAETVQNCMDEFLQVIKQSTSIIWDKSVPSSFTEMENVEMFMSAEYQVLPATRNLIEPYIKYPPEARSSSWKLDVF